MTTEQIVNSAISHLRWEGQYIFADAIEKLLQTLVERDKEIERYEIQAGINVDIGQALIGSQKEIEQSKAALEIAVEGLEDVARGRRYGIECSALAQQALDRINQYTNPTT